MSMVQAMAPAAPAGFHSCMESYWKLVDFRKLGDALFCRAGIGLQSLLRNSIINLCVSVPATAAAARE